MHSSEEDTSYTAGDRSVGKRGIDAGCTRRAEEGSGQSSMVFISPFQAGHGNEEDLCTLSTLPEHKGFNTYHPSPSTRWLAPSTLVLHDHTITLPQPPPPTRRSISKRPSFARSSSMQSVRFEVKRPDGSFNDGLSLHSSDGEEDLPEQEEEERPTSASATQEPHLYVVGGSSRPSRLRRSSTDLEEGTRPSATTFD